LPDARRLILLAAETGTSAPHRKPPVRPDHLTAAELSPGANFVEGAAHPVVVNSFERNHAARKRCLMHYGRTCSVCGFEFERVYGEAAAGYMQVHHIVPIASIGQEYRLDPLRDLRPVCPNCHAVIHRREPPYSPEEVRRMPGRKSRPQA
jgi:5-methylcytosine-specific restriction protein A